MPKNNTTDSYTMEGPLSPCFFSADFYQKRKKGKYRLVHAPKLASSIADTHCHIEMLYRPEWAFIRCALHNVGFVACVIDSVDDGPEGIEIVEEAYRRASKMLPDVVQQIKQKGKQAEDIVTIKVDDEPALCLDVDSIADTPKLPDLRYIIGCHPHHSKDFNDKQEQVFRKMLTHKRACAVGEIGLDFHYDLSPRATQVEIFKRQLKIANELGFPVSLHLREAHDVALSALDEVGFCKHGTLLHCFNLGPKELKPWVDAGCYIALGGPVTFKKSDETREAFGMISPDKLLTETDAPFMTPEPVRGDTCFPDHVVFTGDLLSKLAKEQVEEDGLACFSDDDQNSKFFDEKFFEQLMSNARALLDRDLLDCQK